jgi:Ca-activated chloride channel family protein
MPSHANTHFDDTRPASIRAELEKLARAENSALSRRLIRRQQARQVREEYSRDTSARRVMRWQDRTLLSLAVVLLLLLIVRVETARADGPWGLELAGVDAAYTALALDTDIRLDITGLLARVTITQRFRNESGAWAEGVYRFPLPEGAAVDRMRVTVGQRVLEGEIQEKHDARRTFEQARNEGRTVSLIEQQRRNQFETRLANIGPGETVEVSIAYLQNVQYSDMSYRLRVPMTFTPRWEPPGGVLSAPRPRLVHASLADDHGLSLTASLASAVELAAIESRYHDVDIRRAADGYKIELLNPNDVTDRDFELSWSPALGSTPAATLATFDDGDAVYAQLMLAPPLADAIAPTSREVVLVIDTSGSMEGDSIEQARSALRHALESLGPDDYFNVLQFNSWASKLFKKSVPVNPAELSEAENYISSLEADGGTNMKSALKAALALPKVSGLMRQVVFITDGSVGNETELLQLVAEQLGGGRLFTVAIGHAPNSWFMRKAAQIGRGSYVHIAKPADVGERMNALWGRIRTPALTDICVDWGEGAEYYPEIIPDLYAGEPLWLTARLPGQPTLVHLCGLLDGSEWNTTVNGWDALAAEGGDNLAKLWARSRIEALEDAAMFGADPELTRLQITATALDYGLLTRHTSLVAVDKTPRRPAGEALAQAEVPNLLPAGSTAQISAFPPTATGWLARAVLSLIVLLLATGMLVFSGSRFPMTRLGAPT